MFDRFFRRSREQGAAAGLYESIMAQARRPGFYSDLEVPDTLDGRFDMVALHLFLVLHRLKGQGAAAESLARRLFERATVDFERTLREMGVGDQGISRRVTAMVGGAKGRMDAYDSALAAGGKAALTVALDNNLYGTRPGVGPMILAAMAGYVRREAAALAVLPLEELLAGHVAFGPPPSGGLDEGGPMENAPGEGGPGENRPRENGPRENGPRENG